MELVRPGIYIDFMKKRHIAYIFSITLTVLSIGSLFVKGLNYGIDFTGGTVVQVKFQKSIKTDEVRSTLDLVGITNARIQSVGETKDNEFLIRTPKEETSSEDISTKFKQIFENAFGKDSTEIRRVEMVGGEVSKDLKVKGLLSLFYAFIGLLIYIWWRFEFRFSIGAILSLIHDTVVTVGIFSITGMEMDLTVIAALLTLIGYSLNDTIVVFDRIRENMRKDESTDFLTLINNSISQTLSRTILTVFTVFLVVICLFFLGGEVIHNFAFAMLVGLVFGTYSSVFVASAVLPLLPHAKK